jgi:hypothetical protein
MIVTPETFQKHLQWLRSGFEIVHLGDWVSAAKAGEPLPRQACAITFDDGWRDNFEFALPILQRTRTPATVFAVSHMIGTREAFWPNRLARVLSSPEYQASNSPALDWLRELMPSTGTASTQRERISAAISAAKALPDRELSERLDRIEQELWPGTTPLALTSRLGRTTGDGGHGPRGRGQPYLPPYTPERHHLPRGHRR